MARKQRDSGGGGDSWMNTYADMVTLLLTFFVLLFSMSTIDAEKWEALVQAFTNSGNETSQIVIAPEGSGNDIGANQGETPPDNGPGGETLEADSLPADLDQLYEYLKRYIDQNNKSGSVEITKDGSNVFIRFSDNIFFNPDEYYLRSDCYDLLNFLGDGLAAVQDQILAININGYTADLVDMTYYPVNDRRLSSERASSVAIFFEEEKNINPEIIIASGFGRLHPIADNSTAEGRSKNRRVDILIISNEDEEAGQQMLAEMLTGAYDPNTYPASGDLPDMLYPDNSSANAQAANSADSGAQSANLQSTDGNAAGDTQNGGNSAQNTDNTAQNPNGTE